MDTFSDLIKANEGEKIEELIETKAISEPIPKEHQLPENDETSIFSFASQQKHNEEETEQMPEESSGFKNKTEERKLNKAIKALEIICLFILSTGLISIMAYGVTHKDKLHINANGSVTSVYSLKTFDYDDNYRFIVTTATSDNYIIKVYSQDRELISFKNIDDTETNKNFKRTSDKSIDRSEIKNYEIALNKDSYYTIEITSTSGNILDLEAKNSKGFVNITDKNCY